MDEADILHKIEALRRHRISDENDYSSASDSDEDEGYTHFKLDLLEYNKSYEEILPNDASDPINAARAAHNNSLADLKTEMLEAINNRKQAVLPTAIQIFNKLQEKHVKSLTLQDYDAKDEEIDQVSGFAKKAEHISDINQSINKLELLVDDQSSPILSAVRSSEKYEVTKLPSTLSEYNQRHSDPVDVAEMMRDAKRLSELNEQLDNIANFADEVEIQLQQRLARAKRHTQA
jgi:hypothetical protein